MIEEGLRGRSLRGLRLSPRARRRPAGASRRPAGARRRTPGAVAGRRLRIVLVLAAIVAVGIGGWIWLRDSSLVAVKRVTITGLSGAQAPRIRAALTDAARGMTTLDVRESTLRAAVSPYPVVKGLSVSTSFPHELRITVHEQLPVAVITVGGHALPVAADGTVLHDTPTSGSLPTLAVKSAPGGDTVTDPTAQLELDVLAAAPGQMLARISGIATDYWHGVTVTVRQGPTIYFGGGDRPTAKWQAALAVLASPSTAGASYIDVSDPQRPAAGASSQGASASGASGTAMSGSTSPAAATSTGAPATSSAAASPATTGVSGTSTSTSGG